jgi:hypothetical protein
MVGDLLTQTVVQDWPLRVKSFGIGVDPVCVPLNPMLTEPLGDMGLLPVAVTLPEPAGCDQVAFQPAPTRCPST